jgi:hypothetical protein
MALFQAACRQIYHETRFLPYELNEFSFQDEMTMKDWFGNRAAAQKRAINTIWFDLEWQRSRTVFPYNNRGAKGAQVHIGGSHGVRTIYVSVAAMQRGWSWVMAEYYSKSMVIPQICVLLRRSKGDLRIEFVK